MALGGGVDGSRITKTGVGIYKKSVARLTTDSAWLTFTSLPEPTTNLRYGVEKEIRAKPCSAGHPRPDLPKTAAEIPVVAIGVVNLIGSIVSCSNTYVIASIIKP